MENQINFSNTLVSSDLKELIGSETENASSTQEREVRNEAKQFVITHYPACLIPKANI